MLDSKEKDILSFLDGNASDKKISAIKEWAYESVENAEELAFLQKIYRESSHLKDYNPVDVDQEWGAFMSSANHSTVPDPLVVADEKPDISIDSGHSHAIGELEILQHLDGATTQKDKNQIAAWAAQSGGNVTDLDLSKKIIDESSSLGSFVSVDADAEWSSFQSVIKGVAPVVPMMPKQTEVVAPVLSEEHKESRATVFPLWMRYAVAASMAILLAAFLWMRQPVDNYATFATTVSTDERTMVDGTLIELGENSSVRYPKSLKGLDERRLYLDGQAKFDVATNEDKKFFVEARNGIGIEVIGTIFKVFAHEDYLEAVENIEGKVRAYSLKDPSIYQDLGPGDRYGWDGTKFINLNEIVEEDNSKEYQVLYVLDFLMANSSWRVISSPNMPFDEEAVVRIDLEQPVQEILDDLKERADFDYVELNCESCYQITRFTQK